MTRRFEKRKLMLTTTTPNENQMAARFHFASLAGQYYVTGRFAALSHCLPVAGTILHHSVEMFLKCGLVEKYPLTKLKSFGHSLPRLWAEFKASTNNTALTTHDWTVTELDKFEQLRYPELMVTDGMFVSMTTFSAEFAELPTGPQPPFHLVLEKIDKLTLSISRACGLSKSAMFSPHNASAMHHLYCNNLHWIENQPINI